jgi:enoyl-CoA hydratase/carnithine racemase
MQKLLESKQGCIPDHEIDCFIIRGGWMDILVERADGVLSILLNRPSRRNALTTMMFRDMAVAFNEAKDDPSVRTILIRGVGGTFSAGNDLDDFVNAPPMNEDAPVAAFLRAISTASKPVVAAVAGAAVGIGTTMLLHCDLVYAAPTARFALPFVKLGLCAEAASSFLLPRVCGYQRAAEKLLLGETFDAAEALDMGIVNRLLPEAELDAFALEQARKLASLPADSVRISKALMKSGLAPEVAKRMDEEAEHFRRMLAGAEAKAALAAFFDKKTPRVPSTS